MTTRTQDDRAAAHAATPSAGDGPADAVDAGGVLQVEDLRVQYGTPRGPIKAVDGVTFTLRPGERFGLVGESGSGKTTTAFALMRLIEPPGEITGGRALLDGVDLLKLSDEEMRQARFAQIALIPQGAMNSLNPVMRIGQQLADTIRAHESGSRDRELDDRVDGLLDSVGLSADVARMYPHELSGGMKQRACIAMAISLRPSVILADEPTSALDVVVQRQVLQTLRRVQQELGASIIFVGHDMGLMAQFVDRIGVMYAGKLVEIGPVKELFGQPKHPLHATPDRKPAKPGFQGRSQGNPRHAAVPPAASRRVRLPSPLPADDGPLPQRGPRTPPGGAGTLGLLPPVRKRQMTALLEARNVTKVFGGGMFRRNQTVAVDNISLELSGDQPSVTVVAGESGSGKTHARPPAAGHHPAHLRRGALQRSGHRQAAARGTKELPAGNPGGLPGPIRVL